MDTVAYIRPTLQKSFLLYAVLSVQPLLLVVMLGLAVILCFTPVGKGFGMLSIVSGVNRESLDALGGAALSRELRDDVKLVINPQHDDENGTIEYYIASIAAGPNGNGGGNLVGSIVYHWDKKG